MRKSPQQSAPDREFYCKNHPTVAAKCTIEIRNVWGGKKTVPVCEECYKESQIVIAKE